jgi:membrane protein YdbS with pleckstrin-like domain
MNRPQIAASGAEGEPMEKSYLARLMADGERVILEARQHWVVLLRETWGAWFLALLIVVGSAFATFSTTLPGVLGFVLLVFPVVWLIAGVLRWRSLRFVITSRRVLCLSGIMSKSVTDSSLDKVNDVKMEQSLWGRMLDYGDIEILTASELGANEFRMIQGPVRFKKAMLDAKGVLEGVGREPGEPSIPELIAQLDALRKQGALTDAEFEKKKAELLSRL